MFILYSNKEIEVYDNAGKLIKKLPALDNCIIRYGTTLSPDNRYLVVNYLVGDSNFHLNVYQFPTLKLLSSWKYPRSYSVSKIVFGINNVLYFLYSEMGSRNSFILAWNFLKDENIHRYQVPDCLQLYSLFYDYFKNKVYFVYRVSSKPPKIVDYLGIGEIDTEKEILDTYHFEQPVNDHFNIYNQVPNDCIYYQNKIIINNDGFISIIDIKTRVATFHIQKGTFNISKDYAVLSSKDDKKISILKSTSIIKNLTLEDGNWWDLKLAGDKLFFQYNGRLEIWNWKEDTVQKIITDKYHFIENYQDRVGYLDFLCFKVIKLLPIIRTLQRIPRFYTVASDSIFEIIYQLLLSEKEIASRQLAEFLNSYTKSWDLKLDKIEFCQKIENLFI